MSTQTGSGRSAGGGAGPRRILRLTAGAIVLLALAAFALAGCRGTIPPTTTIQPQTTTSTTVATSTTETTSTAEETSPTLATGPISTPAAGTSTRQALMNAARTKLKTTSQFRIYQLYVQGDTAIGDLEAVSGGKRVFVAWKGPGWTAVWTAPFGSSTANAKAAASALEGFSQELIGRIDFKLAKPLGSSAMKASLTAAAKTWSDQAMGGVGAPYKVTTAKVAQDSNGTWWGVAVTQPTPDSNNSYEPLQFWCKFENGSWNGKIQDPEPPAPNTFFPKSVVSALGL